MTDEPCVWASKFASSVDSIYFIEPIGVDEEWVGNHYERRDPIISDSMPTGLRLQQEPAPQVDYFVGIGRMTLVSDRFADLLRSFDLGPAPTPEVPNPLRTQIHNMPLWDTEMKTKLGDLALVQVTTEKDGFIPDESQFRKHYPTTDQYLVTPLMNNLAFDSSVLEGPDIWLDRRIPQAVYFISDRLHRAMEEAEITPPYKFKRCRVLG